MNAERQKQIVVDTERLLSLAKELQVAVPAATDGPASQEIAKKIEEIEKLAHQVRQKEIE